MSDKYVFPVFLVQSDATFRLFYGSARSPDGRGRSLPLDRIAIQSNRKKTPEYDDEDSIYFHEFPKIKKTSGPGAYAPQASGFTRLGRVVDAPGPIPRVTELPYRDCTQYKLRAAALPEYKDLIVQSAYDCFGWGLRPRSLRRRSGEAQEGLNAELAFFAGVADKL